MTYSTGSMPVQKITLDDLRRNGDNLPQMPQVAVQLMQLLEDPNSGADDLAKIIRLDPKLTAQILRLCNSASYGLRREVLTVKEAVAVLGMRVLKSMVYVILSKAVLDKSLDEYGLEKGMLWRSALTGAVFSKELVRIRNLNVDAELAFTVALLRSIGRIVLAEYVGAAYAQVLNYAESNKVNYLEAESQILGLDHRKAGVFIAKHWDLPKPFQAVIQYKDKPSEFPLTDRQMEPAHYQLACVVHIADMFCKLSGVGAAPDELMCSLDEEAFDTLKIPLQDDVIEQLMSRLTLKLSAVDEMMAAFEGDQ